MDNKTIIRINGMLKNTPPGRLEAFVQGLREQMGLLAARQRRAEALALLVAAAFLFIEIAAIGPQVTVGPFEITNLKEIEPILPILYSYFVYEEVVSASQYVFARGVWDASIKVYDRRLYDTGLDRLLVPPLSLARRTLVYTGNGH